jgi:hypothetical protein
VNSVISVCPASMMISGYLICKMPVIIAFLSRVTSYRKDKKKVDLLDLTGEVWCASDSRYIYFFNI